MLTAGTKAPDFSLSDQHGNTVSLADYAGKKIVLYFYPRDNTPGCSRQACAFAGAYEDFKTMNVAVIGVSKDSVASHVKFAEKYSLPFILLSDPELQAIQAYDVWQEKKNYGKVSMGVVRSTYIIDENGVIEKVMPKVKPDTNAAEILEYLTPITGTVPPEVPLETMAQYLAALERQPLPVNVGMLVGAGVLRANAAGYGAQLEDGDAYIEARPPAELAVSCQRIFMVIVNGLNLLANQYDQYVRFEAD